MNKRLFIQLLFIFIAVFSTQFFNYAYWKQLTGGIDIYYYAIYPIIVLLAIPGIRLINNKSLYSKDVKAILAVSYLCIITIVLRGGWISMDLDLPPMLFSMTILVYFILVYYKISVKSLVSCLTFVGLVVLFIQIFQQLFPSVATFGINDPEKGNYFSDIANVRNNLYRFLLPTYQLTLVCMFYWWSRLLDGRNVKTLVLFCCFVISMYLYLTRQVIFSAIATLAITPFFMINKTTNKRAGRTITFLLVVVVILLAPNILGELIDMTKEGGDSTDLRMVSYVFFGEKIFATPFSFLFGNGTPPETIAWHEAELNASDIGFVGEVFHKGIFALIIYLWLLYKLLIKNRKITPIYVKQYVFCSFINSILAFPYIQGYEYFLWAILLYLSEDAHLLYNHDNNVTTKAMG